jgi:cell division septation protein DedD
MKHWGRGAVLGAAGLAALAIGGVARADVKAGVDAWSRGDYAAAVHQWEGPASVGDADAMFNLAQAYRLGRGVPQDLTRAEALYAQAAAKGHVQAADTYGLMLFQDGRKAAALPYIEDAARRGDPRSEYLLGVARFNGDIVSKDWVQAYALVTMANAQGLPQAAAALAQMDQHIPLAQRQQAAGLAVQMQKQADATRGRVLAAADLGAGVSSGSRKPVAAKPALPARPVATVAVSPSVAAALAAVAEARQATGTESPAEAGASFARRASAPSEKTEKREKPGPRVAAVAPKETAASAPKTGTPAAPAGESGPWRVQLGAFAVRGNADRLWTRLSGRSELAGRAKLAIPAGAVTKLQAGGYPSRDAAEGACRSLKRIGQECLVTR